MTGIIRVTVLLSAAGWTAAVLVGSASPRPTQAATGTRESSPRIPRYEGATSCAAAACHNNGEPAATKGSEFSLWASQDPHATRAFGVLFNQKSRQIVANLNLKTPAHTQEQCLVCHGFHTAPAERGEKLLEFVPPHSRSDGVLLETVREGVGCEKCHGPSSEWRTTHYLRDWDRGTALGLVNTKNLSDRIQQCAACHVGDAAEVGHARREVNHDLIAAGHPRLLFDYATHHQMLPKHWREGGKGSDFLARAWLVGQLAGARAAVDQLKRRADRADREPAKAVWPEFSESNCTACHHGLIGDGARQNRGFTGKPGDLLPWNGWHTAMPKALLRLDAALVRRPDDVNSTLFSELEKEMARPRPDPKRVVAESSRVSQKLAQWMDHLHRSGSLEAESLRKHLGASSLDGNLEWERATQAFLSIESLERAKEESTGRRTDEGYRTAAGRLRQMLQYPRGYDSVPRFDPAGVLRGFKDLER